MSNDKVIEEMLSRIQILEEKVEVLSQKILGEDTTNKDSDKKEKRCMPGYNSCEIG